MSSQHIEIVEQAIWGIGNIAGDSYEMRDLVLNEGVVLPISNFLDKCQPGSSMVRNASWALYNLCRGSPFPHFSKI
jgi:importin subunit alpha-6/7